MTERIPCSNLAIAAMNEQLDLGSLRALGTSVNRFFLRWKSLALSAAGSFNGPLISSRYDVDICGHDASPI